MEQQRYDVVVAGAGIAGAALAAVLARRGQQVLLLERQTTFRDKVRGETLLLWGVEEMLRLGLEDAFLAAGGCYQTRGVRYDEMWSPADAEAAAAPLDRMLPGVPGVLDVGHPEACEALTGAAAAAGAVVVRGVGGVEVEPGAAPGVAYASGGVRHEVSCRLVVGADGRSSTVRRRLGLDLRRSAPRAMGGGLLVDGLDAWPTGRIALGTEGDLYYFVFPRQAGRVRLYLLHALEQRGRFAGPGRERAFLDAFRLRCLPEGDAVAAARPAGLCAFYPFGDTWVDEPCADGVVLVGDAAGWSDPIIGQGLSVALRDARWVADVVGAGPERSAAAFAAYADERRERMRRLRVVAQLRHDLYTSFTPQATAARRRYSQVAVGDPVLGGPDVAPLLGPERLPAEAFTPANVARVKALA